MRMEAFRKCKQEEEEEWINKGYYQLPSAVNSLPIYDGSDSDDDDGPGINCCDVRIPAAPPQKNFNDSNDNWLDTLFSDSNNETDIEPCASPIVPCYASCPTNKV